MSLLSQRNAHLLNVWTTLNYYCVRRNSSKITANRSVRYNKRTEDPDALRRIESLISNLVQESKRGLTGKLDDWHHGKHESGLENVVQRLATSVNDLSASDTPEKSQFFSDNYEDLHSLPSEAHIATGIRPGSFVELRRNNVITHGVVIDLVVIEGFPRAVTLVVWGAYWEHRLDDIMFAIPGFVDQDLVHACGLDPVTRTMEERYNRFQVIKQTRRFERQVERAFNSLGRSVNRLYPLLASTDESRWATVTTKQVTTLFESRRDPPVATLLATHKHLMSRSTHFLASPRDHRTTHTFYVRPRRDVENIELIEDWMRKRSHQLGDFVNKSREIVRMSRNIRTKPDQDQITQIAISTPQFTAADREFILFLQRSVRQSRKVQQDPYSYLAPSIVKDTGMYDTIITVETVHQFLREIGVCTPWDDPVIYDQDQEREILADTRRSKPHLGLKPQISQTTSQTIQKPEAAKIHHTSPAYGLQMNDTLKDARHDFGDLPVFVIDDYGAEELDDGISVELPPSRDGSLWMHVHIADPTAYLDPTHPISESAEAIMTSRYLLQRTIPMLPQSIADACHLGANQKDGRGLPVLTFSAKLDAEGTILDYQVRAGIIRNIHILRYDDVDASLNLQRFVPFWPFGPPSPQKHQNIPAQHKQALTFLDDLARRMQRNRRNDGFLAPAFVRAQLHVSPRPLPSNSNDAHSPVFYSGAPAVKYLVAKSNMQDVGSRALVAECVKVACRVASRWFSQHKVPAVHRCLAPCSSMHPGALEAVMAMRNSACYVPEVELRRHKIYFPTTELSLEPKGHSSLGVLDGEGYTQVTSPLRRFTDLAHHWQIKHILGGGRSAEVPFSTHALAEKLLFWSTKEKVANGVSMRQTRYWALSYVQKWMASTRDTTFKNPLSHLHCQVMGAPIWDPIRRRYATPVSVNSLGLTAFVVTNTRPLFEIGTTLQAAIKHIELGINSQMELFLL